MVATVLAQVEKDGGMKRRLFERALALGVRAFEVLPGAWVDVVAYACVAPPADLRVSAEHTAAAFVDPAEAELPALYAELVAHQSRWPSTSSRGASPRLGAPMTRNSRPSGPAS